MLKRAAESRDDFKIIMFNHEDVNRRYAAKPTTNEYFVFVQAGKAIRTSFRESHANPNRPTRRLARCGVLYV